MPLSFSDVHPVILAGGLGTRLRQVVSGRPKPLATADGRPFLDWVVRFLHASGCSAATISTGYLAEMIAHHFQESPVPGLAVACVPEDRPLGTAGGFRNAARQSGHNPDAWLVLNGDSLIFADLPNALAAMDRAQADAAIIARHVDDAGRFGSLAIDDSGMLTAFHEKTPGLTAPGWINAGVYLLRGSLLEQFPERDPLSFEYDVFPNLIEAGTRILVVASDAPFLDIGTEATLALADDFIRSNRGRFS